jgi:hypothetical protein
LCAEGLGVFSHESGDHGPGVDPGLVPRPGPRREQ